MNKKVLIIEDEKDLRIAMADVLRRNKFAVFEAQDGEAGLAVAFAEHPDIVLLDVLMPKMDGMTALGKLRSDPWGKDVPVIILTNLNATDERVIEDIVTHKPLHYFIKSDWDIRAIVEEIRKTLAQTR